MRPVVEVFEVEDPQSEAAKWKREQLKDESAIQRRIITDDIHVRYESGGPPKIQGYAAVFDQTVELGPGFRERVAPGAFSETIKNDDIRALIDHLPQHILGRNKAKTLTLKEDDKGLYYEILPPDRQDARDLIVSIKRGDVTQSSFGFSILKREVEIDEEKDELTRTLVKVKLYDVSPVTFPAYPQTEVKVRMFRNACLSVFCFEDDHNPILLPVEDKPAAELSDEDLFRKIDELKKAGLGPGV